MSSHRPHPSPQATAARVVDQTASATPSDTHRWDLSPIFADWTAWEDAYSAFEARLGRYAELQGGLSEGPDELLEVLQLGDELGQLATRLWSLPSLRHDLDQRDNATDAKRQRAQALFARWQQATAWVAPEILAISWATLGEWIEQSSSLALYRFHLEDLYRREEHVLGTDGEHLLSLASRFSEAPEDAYSALSTADFVAPTVELSSGESVKVTHGRYRALLATCREQADRAAVFEAFHASFQRTLNTYAALYNGVCLRDWFTAQARRYDSTLEAALFGRAIPVDVVETLIATTYAGGAPLRRYSRLRRRALALDQYHLYDGSISLVPDDRRYPYEDASAWVIDSVAPLGRDYQERMRRAFAGGWIDVYEAEGKRSGAYSAGVYGVHPYVLLNYNETLDDVFTLAHEMGHSLHTLLSHESQPFVYAQYSIFVAEVASTLNEGLLLDHLLAQRNDPRERVNLLQHAIDSVVGTFYTQVLFAAWELEAHRRAERGEPLTAEILSGLYLDLVRQLYGDAADIGDTYRTTWSRIPHFFQSPYYVYQYATSFAASAQLLDELRSGNESERRAVVESTLALLRSGGSSYPIDQLRVAGVDLTRPQPVESVVERLDDLVTRLEGELVALGVL